MTPPIKDLKEHLLTHRIVDPVSGCWLWTRGKNSKGYGKLERFGITQAIHCLSYEMFKGPRNGMNCLHTCDTPACFNPEHLFLGTHKDNAVDREKKGRGRQQRGENQGGSKLTEAQVLAMKAEYKNVPKEKRYGMQVKFIHKYGISSAQVSRILNGKHWVHLNRRD